MKPIKKAGNYDDISGISNQRADQAGGAENRISGSDGDPAAGDPAYYSGS